MSIDRLLGMASPPLSTSLPARETCPDTPLGQQLWQLLSRRNGFYALNSALHVYPAVSGEEGAQHILRTLQGAYGDLAAGLHCFGEDVFGNQFVLCDDSIGLFDVETGETEEITRSLEEWAACLLNDDYWSGWSLAHQWQTQHGSLKPGVRLIPKRAFILGGQFTVENLYVLNALDGIKYRACIALQIRDLPDGTVVKLSVID
jgi:hypothetical protein